MDVDLYVYDLSKGMARMYSMPLAGIQIDAIYHTSMVFGGIEYYFGQGIGRAVPGTTHHGQPMQVTRMGRTELPPEIIEEYIESLEGIYTAESYDLFLHNCNNFTQDLSMFLVGKSIPDTIRSLPETVLNTPFGQMIRPTIDAAMRPITQAPNAAQPVQPMPRRAAAPASNGFGGSGVHANGSSTAMSQVPKPQPVEGVVRNITSIRELDSLLSAAKKSCAVIFFTSATCPPCKIVYPTYDELAAEAGDKATLIKVDISRAYDIASRYQVRATPTFMTFLHGEKENEWSGANPGLLRGNVRLLIQMAHPPHPHDNLRLPSLQRKVEPYVIYRKIPPIEKLVSKMGPQGADPAVTSIVAFIQKREAVGAAGAPLPDLHAFGAFICTAMPKIPLESRFALVDLVRLAFVDPRVSGYFAEEAGFGTVNALFAETKDVEACPWNMRIVMLQLACNFFTTPLFPRQILANDALRDTAISLVSACLLDTTRSTIRVTAASLIYNITAYVHNERFEARPSPISESLQFELVAALLEAIQNEEESVDCLRGLLRALGQLLYGVEVEGELAELVKALGAAETVKGKKRIEAFKKEPLIEEIGGVLLERGFR